MPRIIRPRIGWWRRARYRLTHRTFLPRGRELVEYESISRRSTAHLRSIYRFGTSFVETFPSARIGENVVWGLGEAAMESSICLGIYTKPKTDAGVVLHKSPPLAQLKLGFEKKSVVIEAMQGARKVGKTIQRINRLLGMPWPNYLLEQVEAQAKACGFSTVKIRRPETLYYFNHPDIETGVESSKVIQKRMIRLYSSAARASGYREEGDFYVKRI